MICAEHIQMPVGQSKHLLFQYHSTSISYINPLSTVFEVLTFFLRLAMMLPVETMAYTCQVTLDISGSPIDFQWGSRKYPG